MSAAVLERLLGKEGAEPVDHVRARRAAIRGYEVLAPLPRGTVIAPEAPPGAQQCNSMMLTTQGGAAHGGARASG